MPKKHRMQVFYGQIMLISLALSTFVLYFTNRLVSVGFVFLATAILLETVAYEEIPLRQTNL